MIHADKHGFLAVPPEDEARLLEAARFMDANECRTVIRPRRGSAGKSTAEIVTAFDAAVGQFGENAAQRLPAARANGHDGTHIQQRRSHDLRTITDLGTLALFFASVAVLLAGSPRVDAPDVKRQASGNGEMTLFAFDDQAIPLRDNLQLTLVPAEKHPQNPVLRCGPQGCPITATPCCTAASFASAASSACGIWE